MTADADECFPFLSAEVDCELFVDAEYLQLALTFQVLVEVLEHVSDIDRVGDFGMEGNYHWVPLPEHSLSPLTTLRIASM